MKQSHILAVAGIVMLILFYITSTSREGFTADEMEKQGFRVTTKLVDEGSHAQIENGARYAYGIKPDRLMFAFADVSNGVLKCDNKYGDPAYGDRKACYKVEPTTPAADASTAAASTATPASSAPAATASSSTASSSPVVTNGAIAPPLPWSETKTYVIGDTITAGDKTYIAILGNKNMGPSNNQFLTYWKAYVATTAGAAAGTSMSTAAQSAFGSLLGKTPTLADATKSVGDTAASTYNSFGAVISSGIAKFGLVLVVGASIVIGVIVVWALWNTFIGRPATAAPPGLAPMIGAPPARWY